MLNKKDNLDLIMEILKLKHPRSALPDRLFTFSGLRERRDESLVIATSVLLIPDMLDTHHTKWVGTQVNRSLYIILNEVINVTISFLLREDSAESL